MKTQCSVILAFAFSFAFLASPSTRADAPVGLVGEFLYFVEGPDDFLIFTDGTNGEERDVDGDVDPFTYTYAITGANTATLVATYDPGDMDYDEWDLTWTGNGKGTFVRREFKDGALDDTDAGGFTENTGDAFPPTDLVGARLEEAIQLEDERFEFQTETVGREFEPGDVDPFTYIYMATEVMTAELKTTFKPDRWNDIELTFDTDSSGTYTLNRYDDNSLKDSKQGDFYLSQNTNTADLAVGNKLNTLVGDDFFNAGGAVQTVQAKTKKKGTVKAFVQLENDGTNDTLRVRSSRGGRKFDIDFYTLNPRRKVTGTITKGSGLKTLLGHDGKQLIQVQAKTKRDKAKANLNLSGASNSIPGANDSAKIKIKKK